MLYQNIAGSNINGHNKKFRTLAGICPTICQILFTASHEFGA